MNACRSSRHPLPRGVRLAAWSAAAASLLATLAGTATAAAEPTLQGRVELLAKGKTTRERAADPRDAVVIFEPSAAPLMRPAPVQATMRTEKKEFVPRVLVVPAGSTVQFPNGDPILHNVFSVSGANRFDLGLVGKGPGKSVTLRAPGLVRVFCNVHHSMVAYLWVVATPFHLRPDAEGRFAFPALPSGRGRLTVWHERAELWQQELELPALPLSVKLEVTRPRVPPHTNKDGQAYRRGAGYE